MISGTSAPPIDNLAYTYRTNNPNQLLSIADATSNAAGFKAGSGNYIFDPEGNLGTDPYKGLTIIYNDLNKIKKITFK